MSELHAIVYVSSATHVPSLDELDCLLDKARARNLVEGITGVLLHCEGNFLQYIEGEHAALSRVFALILADSLHFGLIVLVSGPVSTREFDAWSMAFAPARIQDFDSLSSAPWNAVAGSNRAAPTISEGRRLLRNVWVRLSAAGH